MSPDTTTNTTKICPTCGTRLNINAARCSVCGSAFSPSATAVSTKAIQGPRIPEVTLSLPLIFSLSVLLLVIGAGSVYAILQSNAPDPVEGGVAVTETATITTTTTITPTPSITPTETPQATWTPLPPIEYTVKEGDTCLLLAAIYGVSTNSIVVLNQLSAECFLSPGQKLNIPQPTASPSPMPTNTLNPTEMAQADCQKVEYFVKEGDTLGGIAANYAVDSASIQSYSGLTTDTVMLGQKLIIPLCEQSLEPPTATPVPPYPAANLLLPADGAGFNAGDVVTLQWAAVGELRQNEAYAVTVIDVTDGNNRRLVEYVTDTKFIIPDNFRPTTNTPHIYYWTVLPVRQVGTDKDSGAPEWEPAGDVSAQRSFSWVGGGAPPASATPTP